MHMDLYVFFYFTLFALHVSEAVCTHHQEHILQSTTIGMRNGYGLQSKVYITKMYGNMNIKKGYVC
jgi:hypothetical protein